MTFVLPTDPTHVMGLYPDLLPTDYRKQLQYPNPLPSLSGAELEKAHLALIDYLTQVGVVQICKEKFTWTSQYLRLLGKECQTLAFHKGMLQESARKQSVVPGIRI